MSTDLTAGVGCPSLLGFGYALPATIRANDDPIFAWLKANHANGDQLFTGYKTRHVLAAGENLIDIMQPAAEQALQAAGILPDQIDLVLGGGSISEHLSPNDLSLLHQRLALPERAWPIVLANEFSQFNAALMLADGLIRAERARHVLIALGSNWTRYVSYFTPQAVSAGDGAAAVVVGPTLTPGHWRYVDQVTITDTSYFGSMFMAGNSLPPAPIPDPAGPTVFSHPYFQITEKGLEGFVAFGMKKAPEAVLTLLDRHRLMGKDVTLISHQASAKLMDHWAEVIDPGQYIDTITEFANTVMVTYLLNLAWAEAEGPGITHDWLVVLALGFDMHANATLLRRD